MIAYRIVVVALCFLVGAGSVSAATQAGSSFSLHTLSSFVELLAFRKIIPYHLVHTARDIVRMIEGVEDLGTVEVRTGMNSGATTLKASQLIEHASRIYDEHADIQGLLLIVKNTSTSSIMLEARRSCQVTYRIYDATGTVRYDSALKPACQSGEKVTYILRAGAARMFPVTHHAKDFALMPGVYRFVLDYPGYGSEELSVTVQSISS